MNCHFLAGEHWKTRAPRKKTNLLEKNEVFHQYIYSLVVLYIFSCIVYTIQLTVNQHPHILSQPWSLSRDVPDSRKEIIQEVAVKMNNNDGRERIRTWAKQESDDLRGFLLLKVPKGPLRSF